LSGKGGALTRATLARHGLRARALHSLTALVIAVLLVTGLALGDVFANSVVTLLGGHLAVNSVHRQLGMILATALVLLVLLLPGRVRCLLHDTIHFKRDELSWPLDFLRFYLRPARHPVPFHDGRFDPLQRVIFAGIIGSVVLVCASGVYIYLAPPLRQLLLAYSIRTHIVASWLLIGFLCAHILAGCGLLRTHRGIATAMFGDGRVAVGLANNLWPGWTRRQTGKTLAGPPGSPSAQSDARDHGAQS
jgi:cytochrome b subunit of formate dehydrogenase